MRKTQVYSSGNSGFLLRMFRLSFAAFSILPLLVIVYIYLRFGEGDNVIGISRDQIMWLLIILGATSIFLFFCVRNLLTKIVVLSNSLRQGVLRKMDRKVIMDLAREQGEVAELAKVFSDITGKLEDNIKALEETKKTLYNVIDTVGKAMTSIDNFDLLIKLILDTIVGALGAEKGAVFSSPGNKSAELKVSVGLEVYSDREISDSLKGYVEDAVLNKKTINITSRERVERDPAYAVFSSAFTCTPFISKDKVWGVMFVADKKNGGDFDGDELKLVSNLSCQIALVYDKIALNKDIESTYFDTMAALALAVEARDTYSRGHSDRVGEYSVIIGMAMGMTEKDIVTLRDAARLHDVGKIGVADGILLKPGRLSPEERLLMNKHPAIGEGIVKPLRSFQHLLDPIRHHHELMDGTGYPDGLGAGEIPLITRILTVADIYDAITSDRAYRKAMSIEQAMEVLNDMAEKGKIDPVVVKTLFTLIEEGKMPNVREGCSRKE